MRRNSVIAAPSRWKVASGSRAPGKVDHFSLSYADYGWKSGIWRLLDFLDSVGLKASVSTNARKRDIAEWAMKREAKPARHG